MELSADRVNAWRLVQHHLLQRAEHQHWLPVVGRIAGVQAQVLSAAELALWARVDHLAVSDVHAALWHDRTLAKTWAMRGTLHLLPASDFPLYIAARQVHPARRPPSWFTYHGVTPNELEAIMEGVADTLHDVPMTREELAHAVAERAQNPKLQELLRSGWGVLLKPSAFRGDLCFGPNRGQNVTFVRPNQWLGAWDAVEPEHALQKILRGYLGAYGPATGDDFARWWGIDAGAAKRLFRSLAGEMTPVAIDDWQGWALRSTVQQIQNTNAPPSVRLLPIFDPYTITLYRQPFVLDQTHKAWVSRPQGWISAVVLVDGRIEGVWECEKQRAQLAIKIDMFGSLTDQVKHGIEAEARRLGSFVEMEAVVASAS